MVAVARKIRLTLDVTEKLNSLLDSLAKETGDTKSDILRKAIALIDVAIEAKRNGKRLAVVDTKDRVETQIVGI